MAYPSSVKLGAPGVYPYQPAPPRALTGVRMDVCAFAGVAPRGPARVPTFDETWRDDRPCVEPERPRSRTVAVAVESFDEYRRLYGGFEGPGLLPYAVASFFEQGGRRAYVARIVHDYPDSADDAKGVAAGDVRGAHTTAGPLRLRARDEGAWGNSLRVAVEFPRAGPTSGARTVGAWRFRQTRGFRAGRFRLSPFGAARPVLRLVSFFSGIGAGSFGAR